MKAFASLVIVGVLFASPSAAVASVSLQEVTKAKQEADGIDVFRLTAEELPDGSIRIHVDVPKQGSSRIARVDVAIVVKGKRLLAVPVQVRVEKAGAWFDFSGDAEMLANSQIHLLIDLADPERGDVGTVYKIHVGSYLPENRRPTRASP
ncbi:MAG: hypothetical protein WED34_17780 [Planctomycetales bacterium]